MVPDGWNRRAINELANERKVRLGRAAEPTVLSVSKDYGLLPQTEKFDRRVASENTSHYKIIERGEFAYDPMLLWSGSIALLTCVDRGIVSPAYYVFKTDSSVDPHYLIRVLKQQKMLGPYMVISQGTNLRRRKAQFSDFGEIELDLPPLPEQRGIVDILDTIDEAIRQTEQVIEKLKQVKHGLLHDLLTRGIDKNGELRPHSKEAPQLYKESPLGRIPKGWEILKTHQLTSFVKSGLSRAIKDQDIGVPVITSTNINNDEFDPTDIKYWHAIDPQGANIPSYFLDDGDILLNFINSIAKIGKACLYKDLGRPAIYTTNIFRVKTSVLTTNEFLWRMLQTSSVRGWIQRITKPAINQASFTKPDFGSIPVGLPPRDEQGAILSRLNASDFQIKREHRVLEKLRTLKHGLMDDLLTGRVRVNVNEKDA